MKIKALSVVSLISLTCMATVADYFFTDNFYQDIENRYGINSVQDFKDWQQLIEDGENLDDFSRLNLVNQFANRKIRYRLDIDHWGKNDYWATPIESLGTRGGDCEDYAIFKFFTLKAMGVDESKLRLMYVRALTINEPHMVLVYFENLRDMPLVLDNLKTKILPANKRTDLKPIYSFNGQGLWLAKAQGLGNAKPTSTGNKNWTELLKRIEQGD
ncbi:hypothetical protein SJ2017_2393 [Shewanella japonica]|uniref:Transglutaminase n=2 Tax=Shewanellaceae TaxID=267890 RepID=A0ABM6JM87_9GAMM|nr:hypothetical protein SJ2017_2393 [Shewanella japonica]